MGHAAGRTDKLTAAGGSAGTGLGLFGTRPLSVGSPDTTRSSLPTHQPATHNPGLGMPPHTRSTSGPAPMPSRLDMAMSPAGLAASPVASPPGLEDVDVATRWQNLQAIRSSSSPFVLSPVFQPSGMQGSPTTSAAPEPWENVELPLASAHGSGTRSRIAPQLLASQSITDAKGVHDRATRAASSAFELVESLADGQYDSTIKLPTQRKNRPVWHDSATSANIPQGPLSPSAAPGVVDFFTMSPAFRSFASSISCSTTATTAAARSDMPSRNARSPRRGPHDATPAHHPFSLHDRELFSMLAGVALRDGEGRSETSGRSDVPPLVSPPSLTSPRPRIMESQSSPPVGRTSGPTFTETSRQMEMDAFPSSRLPADMTVAVSCSLRSRTGTCSPLIKFTSAQSGKGDLRAHSAPITPGDKTKQASELMHQVGTSFTAETTRHAGAGAFKAAEAAPQVIIYAGFHQAQSDGQVAQVAQFVRDIARSHQVPVPPADTVTRVGRTHSYRLQLTSAHDAAIWRSMLTGKQLDGLAVCVAQPSQAQAQRIDAAANALRTLRLLLAQLNWTDAALAKPTTRSPPPGTDSLSHGVTAFSDFTAIAESPPQQPVQAQRMVVQPAGFPMFSAPVSFHDPQFAVPSPSHDRVQRTVRSAASANNSTNAPPTKAPLIKETKEKDDRAAEVFITVPFYQAQTDGQTERVWRLLIDLARLHNVSKPSRQAVDRVGRTHTYRLRVGSTTSAAAWIERMKGAHIGELKVQVAVPSKAQAARVAEAESVPLRGARTVRAVLEALRWEE